ncbi:MAG: 2-hydroxyacyl-CoA dehydratase [Deltaproteobacteria bacterium]|nr:2-hydroxyacyl-CoA dehydratase [Deltaproteobacteria bacterium]MBW2053313.1 2-hydroxyacyl-CoA dehydratase [Deltaproteobacteria bacterium]MBW2142453.1 2-hydroxyacyl-CoA dehydratase [Deltaproteobacteria bacterium]
MVTSENTKMNGLERAKQLSKNRGLRAKELRSQGRKIIGYLCSYAPLEFFTALDLVPHRIMGSVGEPIIKADAYLEPIACPFVRSCLDKALKDDYDFLDGVVFPHSCDNVQHLSSIWNYYLKPELYYFLNVPHMTEPSSFEFFKSELTAFKKYLEDFAGKELTDQALLEAIKLHNKNRALLRELNALRKQDTPLISGAELLQTMVATMVLPADEETGLIESVIEEVKNRPPKDSDEDRPRIMIYGCEIDSPEFMQMVEDSGASVVMDDLCTGTRGYWEGVDETGDPVEAIANRYLDKLRCPRTYRVSPGTHEADIANRFEYLKEYAEEFDVNGAILYIIRYCDTQEFDAPDVRDYLQSIGLPVLHIEDDYTLAGIEGLRTRVQAFVEMIV